MTTSAILGDHSFRHFRAHAPSKLIPSLCPPTSTEIPHSVTSGGGTISSRPEVAAPFSAGGFSNIFARPDYQSNTVQNYLTALGTTHTGRFNTSGRAFPDVSAQAVQFVINSAGQFLDADCAAASVRHECRIEQWLWGAQRCTDVFVADWTSSPCPPSPGTGMTT